MNNANSSLKSRLVILNFLQFAVWGAYLTCMSNYLGKAGMGDQVSWFYAIQGIVSIFMPAIIGMIADKYVQPQRMLGFCHLVSGAMMLILGYLGMSSETPDVTLFMSVYTLGVAFYMPTLALSNSVAFTILKNNGMDTVKCFPPIRVMGTIGFIATMWFVNCATTTGGFGFAIEEDPNKFQYTEMQFVVSGVLGVLLFLYSLTLPNCPLVKTQTKKSFASVFGFDAFKLLKNKQMAMFFVFSALLGMALQVTNSYATPFISSFGASEEFKDAFFAHNPTLLVSLSQVAEALCILLIPYFLKNFGIKRVMLIAMLAWVFRFGFFGLGNPEFPGVFLFILSCIVYGVAFDFFNVSGGLYVDQVCEPSMRASGQGLFMLMTNGIGASVGTIVAGKIIDAHCSWGAGGLCENEPGGWSTCWFIFAGYALVVAILFMMLFRYKHVKE